ncbi:MAG TPA: hypothetical protein VGS19_27275 [Streptosporangiaceae bacterium]|nr:hypothetical protein [Streptosporangiaceae bacterium]
MGAPLPPAKIGKYTGPDPSPDTPAPVDFMRRDGTTRPVTSADLTAVGQFAPTGLTGATAASRYVGATASGAPASGTFAVGDHVIDQTGYLWVCTVAGTPGTWVRVPPATMAPVAAKPSDPVTATISTSLSLQGYGSSVTFTPLSSGVCEIEVVTFAQTATAAAQVVVQGRYGTASTAPGGVQAVTVSSGTGAAALFTGTAPMPSGAQVYVTGTTQPGNFTAGTPYFVVTPSGNTWYLAATLNGTAIAFSTAGTAVQTGVVASTWGTRFGSPSAQGVKGGSAGSPACWSNFDIVTLPVGTASAIDLGISTGSTADAASISGTIVKVRELA